MIQEQEKFQLSALNPYLICSVCNGYFRFAHTLSECGHTFCLICITSKTHCPRCPNTQITKTTLRKDPYLQSIVDMFFPEFQKEDQIILDRLQKLFGENIDFNDLQSLLVEKSYEFKKNKKKKKFEQKQGLAHLVEVTFNGTVSYEQFKDNIYDEQKFKLYLNQIKKQYKETCKIEQTKQSVLIAGKRESDNQIAKLNCRVTYHHNEQLGLIKRLRRLVLKSVKKQDNIEKLIDVNRATIDNIKLFYNGKELDDNENEDRLFAGAGDITITYEILFKL